MAGGLSERIRKLPLAWRLGGEAQAQMGMQR